MSKQFSGYRDKRLQASILGHIDRYGHEGLTVRELQTFYNPTTQAHHGDISGALAELHKSMKIARLAERREGCKVYVQLDFIDGRQCEAQGRGGLSTEEIERLQRIQEFLDYYMQIDTEGAKIATDRTKAERNHRLFFKELRKLWEVDL